MPDKADKTKTDETDKAMHPDAPEQPFPTRKKPGDEMLDMNRTPGEGVLKGSTPAGLTVDQLRKRAEDEDGSSEPGTG